MRYIAVVERAKKRYFVPVPVLYTADDEIIDWLESTPGQGFSLDWRDNETDYWKETRGVHFYDEKDAIMFALRWL